MRLFCELVRDGQEQGEQLGCLRAGGVALRAERAVLVAVQDARDAHELDELTGILGNLVGVREGPGRVLGLRQLDALLQGVAAEDRGHLLAGDRGLRVELRGGDALDDALVLGPRDVGLGPVALAVLKRMLALVGLERFGVREGAGQQLDELGAGAACPPARRSWRSCR